MGIFLKKKEGIREYSSRRSKGYGNIPQEEGRDKGIFLKNKEGIREYSSRRRRG